MALQKLTPPPASLPGIVVPQHTTPIPPQSLITRGQRFLEDNWVPIVIAVGVLGVGGYVYYSNAQRDEGLGGSGSRSGVGGEKKKGKGGKKKKNVHLAGEGSDGPLVEEIPQDVSRFLAGCDV